MGQRGSRNIKSKLLHLSSEKSKGHVYVTFKQNDKSYFYYIDQLVAKLFIPNPHHYPSVIHKRKDPQDNHASNLYWGCTSKNVQLTDKNGKVHYFKSPHTAAVWLMNHYPNKSKSVHSYAASIRRYSRRTKHGELINLDQIAGSKYRHRKRTRFSVAMPKSELKIFVKACGGEKRSRQIIKQYIKDTIQDYKEKSNE